MGINTKAFLNIPLIISFIIFNSILLAQNVNEQTPQDSLDVPKQFKIRNQDFLKKDIFGNPISEKEIEDFDYKDREEQKDLIVSDIISMIFAFPIILPRKMLNDECSEGNRYYYQKYPFEYNDGFMSDFGRKWMGNFTLSSQYVNNNVVGYKFNSSFRFLRLSIEPSYSYYYDNKEKFIINYNTLIMLTFAQNEFINFKTGFGYNHFETNSKFDGIDWKYEIGFINKPFHFNLSYKLTGYDFESEEKVKINNDFNINLGYFFNRFEIKLGYRWHKIGEVKLNGPEISGVLWF